MTISHLAVMGIKFHSTEIPFFCVLSNSCPSVQIETVHIGRYSLCAFGCRLILLIYALIACIVIASWFSVSSVYLLKRKCCGCVPVDDSSSTEILFPPTFLSVRDVANSP